MINLSNLIAQAQLYEGYASMAALVLGLLIIAVLVLAVLPRFMRSLRELEVALDDQKDRRLWG